MNRLVLDASVALKMIFVSEKDSPRAVALQDDFRKQVRQLIAPDVLPAEMGHALMRAERRGIIRKGEGQVLFLDFIDPCPQLFAYGDLYDRAMEIASDYRIGFYDALYVTLAEQEGCDLVTADDKLVNALPGFPIVSLSAL
jgi:predicted nucleic acid-binding protein